MAGVYRHVARTPQPAKPSAVFLAFRTVSFGVPTASDGAYQRKRPDPIRLPRKMSAAFLDNPPPATVILRFPKTAADGAYQRPDPAPTRQPARGSAAFLAAPIASISGTMSFTITDLTMTIVIDRPAVTTWTNASTATTTWTAPLT